MSKPPEYQRDIPRPSDPLGQALYLLRLNGSLYCQSEFMAPWGVALPAMEGKMLFHIVTEGGCWLRVADHPSVYLPPGSLALLPKGKGHAIASATDMTCENLFDIPIIQLSERYELLSYGGEGELTTMMCGVIGFDYAIGAKLVDQLPDLIYIDTREAGLSDWLQSCIRFMADEAAGLRPGGETIMAHLADIIIIQAIRHWIESAPEAQQGWLGALQDAKLGKALAAIHDEPGKLWTVDNLAKKAGMSRSGFSARFSELVGTSVKQYVTQWRMSLARAKLSSGRIPLGDLAEELGYQSEAAFSRAYKRVMGESPVRGLSL